VLAQRGQRRVMAGIEHQHVGAVVKGHGQGALDVAREGLQFAAPGAPEPVARPKVIFGRIL